MMLRYSVLLSNIVTEVMEGALKLLLGLPAVARSAQRLQVIDVPHQQRATCVRYNVVAVSGDGD